MQVHHLISLGGWTDVIPMHIVADILDGTGNRSKRRPRIKILVNVFILINASIETLLCRESLPDSLPDLQMANAFGMATVICIPFPISGTVSECSATLVLGWSTLRDTVGNQR